MALSVINCPRTGLNVQVWLPEVVPTDQPNVYESVSCPACTALHLINKNTGRLLGDETGRNNRRARSPVLQGKPA
jgi:hypothetical protein